MSRCQKCDHHPHPDRKCATKHVSGPPSTKGKQDGDGFNHAGRTVTICDCDAYVPDVNGKAVA